MKKTVATHLDPVEAAHVNAAAKNQGVSISAYLRHLVMEAMRRADVDALMALCMDEIADKQHAHGQMLSEIQASLNLAFQQVSNQLAVVSETQARNAEAELQLRQRILDSHAETSKLITETISECHQILDADNSILESIDRRLKSGGA